MCPSGVKENMSDAPPGECLENLAWDRRLCQRALQKHPFIPSRVTVVPGRAKA